MISLSLLCDLLSTSIFINYFRFCRLTHSSHAHTTKSTTKTTWRGIRLVWGATTHSSTTAAEIHSRMPTTHSSEFFTYTSENVIQIYTSKIGKWTPLPWISLVLIWVTHSHTLPRLIIWFFICVFFNLLRSIFNLASLFTDFLFFLFFFHHSFQFLLSLFISCFFIFPGLFFFLCLYFLIFDILKPSLVFLCFRCCFIFF